MINVDYDNHFNLVKEVKTLSIDEYIEKFVDFNQTIDACKQCPAYNKNWSCPSFDKDYLDFYNGYEKIDLILIRLIFDEYLLEKRFSKDQFNEILHETLFKQKDILTKELRIIEKERNGRILSSGYCNICKQCSRINNEECVFPDLKRNSVESIGGLVIKITKDLFDVEIKWIDDSGKLPEYLSILNAVMY